MREVSERRQRRQPAGVMHTIAMVQVLLGIASLLAHRRCLIDSPVSLARSTHGCGGSILTICRWETVCETAARDGGGWRLYPRVLRELRTEWCGACDSSASVRHAIAARIARFCAGRCADAGRDSRREGSHLCGCTVWLPWSPVDKKVP